MSTGQAIVKIRDPEKIEHGSVELVFTGAKPELEKFTVQNENGLSTSITLEDIEYPDKINDTLFSIQLEINKSKRKN